MGIDLEISRPRRSVSRGFREGEREEASLAGFSYDRSSYFDKPLNIGYTLYKSARTKPLACSFSARIGQEKDILFPLAGL